MPTADNSRIEPPVLSTPFFSVVLTVYNGKQFLARTIESVLRQSFQSWEFLIVDDVSTDNTLDIIRGYASGEPRIRLIMNEKNIHCGPSANKAIRIARGGWITVIDADDVYEPQYLEVLYRYVKPHEGKDTFFTSWFNAIDEKDRPILGVKLPASDTIRRMMWKENFICHASTSYSKSLWEKVGGYPEIRSMGIDAELWKRFFEAEARHEVIPEYLVNYRVHYGNMTSTFNGVDHPDRPASIKEQRSNKEWKISLYLKQSRLKDARIETRELFRIQKYLTPKNIFYFFLSYLPVSWVYFFMWEIRPYFRYYWRKLFHV